ncbi:hypothetical protein IGI04_030109 [Brassica rapa subsp. trilocularis]|uniref:Phospholipid/glycerol acyltransferase domain-containing protein n=1 Tax=Brassica rapa subsp. trilocularis TaxID=1813537 RepID=A0ABQ7LPS0_BRACM|nr:hypothetical protein IGI04_030109 [Brassica rapa subsp. trilocularis]
MAVEGAKGLNQVVEDAKVMTCFPFYVYTVKTQTLILLSGRDQWLLNKEDTDRLRCALPKCEVLEFVNNGQFHFLLRCSHLLHEDGVDLATILKIAYYYRRAKKLDYIYDYTLPTPFELKEFEQSQRLLIAVVLVFLSTLVNGTIERTLGGIPLKGPVLYVGNHIFLDLELRPAAIHFLKKRNIIFCGLAHPVMFAKNISSKLPDVQMFLTVRIIGAVPVANMNFYKLLRSKAHGVLYPEDLARGARSSPSALLYVNSTPPVWLAGLSGASS